MNRSEAMARTGGSRRWPDRDDDVSSRKKVLWEVHDSSSDCGEGIIVSSRGSVVLMDGLRNVGSSRCDKRSAKRIINVSKLPIPLLL